MNTLRKPIVLVTIGMIAGYVFQRVLDRVPVVNSLPKIRIGGL
jgi:hypothetical protein